MKQEGIWIQSENEMPKYEGWYLVRTENTKDAVTIALHYRPKRDQWFVSTDTNHCWKGVQPSSWLKLYV